MRSIRSRLTASLCIAIGALLVIAGLFVFFATKRMLSDQFNETLIAKGSAIITATEVDDGELEVEMTLEDFAGFGAGGDYFEIRRESGEVVIDSPSLQGSVGERSKAIGEIPVPEDDEPRIISGKMEDGRSARFFVQSFQPRGGGKKRALFSDLHVVVSSPTAEMDRNVAGLAMVLLLGGMGTLLATVPLIRIALGRGLRSLEDLSRQVQAISPEQLDHRLDEKGMPAELAPVAMGLNAWLARLEESFQRERRFSSDAAHELRTPLAELKVIAESGARWRDEATPERCGEMLEVIDELESLLEKLALISRTDAGSQSLRSAEIDLAAAVDTAIARVQPKPLERNIRILPNVEANAFVSDPDLFGTVLGNLIGNAVSYAPAGSDVEVRVSPKRLLVANFAPALSSSDLPHLFRRFWRKDASRTGSGHSGLGLSIVDACVKLLGGRCEARLTSGGMLEIEVEWPPQKPV